MCYVRDLLDPVVAYLFHSNLQEYIALMFDFYVRQLCCFEIIEGSYFELTV